MRDSSVIRMITCRRNGEEVVLDPEEMVEEDREAPGSGEPRRTARRRTQARARRRDSARRTHHGRCCHRRLNDDRRWSMNGRRLIVSRGGGPATAPLSPHPLGGPGGGAPHRDLRRCGRKLLDFSLVFLRLAPSDLPRGADGSVVTPPRLQEDVGCLA
jgi:hypothetical protein